MLLVFNFWKTVFIRDVDLPFHIENLSDTPHLTYHLSASPLEKLAALVEATTVRQSCLSLLLCTT